MSLATRMNKTISLEAPQGRFAVYLVGWNSIGVLSIYNEIIPSSGELGCAGKASSAFEKYVKVTEGS